MSFWPIITFHNPHVKVGQVIWPIITFHNPHVKVGQVDLAHYENSSFKKIGPS